VYHSVIFIDFSVNFQRFCVTCLYYFSYLATGVMEPMTIRYGETMNIVQGSFWNRLFRITAITSVVIGMLFAAASAKAACGNPEIWKPGAASRQLLLAQPKSTASQIESSNSVADLFLNRNHSIVGLWYVAYAVDGNPLYDALDQWHSDGTEFENANLPPAEGNICLGVWKQTGPRTAKLHHIGLNFDANGNPIGHFTLDETNTVSRDGNTYKVLLTTKHMTATETSCRN